MATALKLRWSPYIPRQPYPSLEREDPPALSPKQFAFLTLDCEEAFYGGAAGGAKSDALLMAALQYADVPSYAALLLRGTFAELSMPNAIMDRAKQWLLPQGIPWNQDLKRFTFPSGATLTFGYLDHADDRFRYQGPEFQFCVGEGTRILMANGIYQPVEDVRVGDLVTTLEGPRPVTYASMPMLKPCYRLSAGGVDTVVSEDHRILTEGGWVSPLEQTPIGCRAYGNIAEVLAPLPRAQRMRSAHSRGDRLPVPWPDEQIPAGTAGPESAAWSASEGTCCGASADGRREWLLPQPWSVRAVLLERAVRPGLQGSGGSYHHHALTRVGDETARQGLLSGCLGSCDSCGGLPQAVLAAVPVHTPSPSGVVAPSPLRSRVGDRGNTRTCSRFARYTYSHPYTREERVACEAVRLSPVRMAPVGVRAVRDLRVAQASHYISHGGIISQNCGFDEVTAFREPDYRWMFSRMRRLADSNIPLRTRSTGNPDGPGFEWVRQRFIVEGRDRGIPFIPANLEDNPYLDRESYIASLDHLDSVTRKRLLHGDWEVRPSGGVFNWWPTYKDLPRLSTIDMPIDTALGGKDYTAATAWGWDGSRVYWLDAMEFQGETPEAERRIQYFKVKLEGKFGVPVKGLHRGNVHIDKIMAQHLRAGVPSTSYSSQGEASEGRMGMPVADVRLPPLKGASEDKRLGLARMVSIEFEGGRALVPEHDEAGMLSRWKEQHTGFPFSDHDDWVETTIVELYHRFRAVPFRRPKEPMEMWGEL